MKPSITTDIKMPHGWRAIPLPAPIEALPKDRKGFPIPYVAEWSSHTDDINTFICNGNVLRLDCDCTIGEGMPELGNQCPSRQRECMSQRKCQVCSLPIEDEYHFLGSIELNVFIEPPLHFECARYSLQVCPGITRRVGMAVHTCSDYELLDKLDFPQFDDGGTVFAPTGQVPIQVAIGLFKAGFSMHGARPIGGERVLTADWLEATR